MGRHDGGGHAIRPWLAVLVAVGALAALGLGWWWWSLRDNRDPVSADPVSAYGSIVTGDSCASPGAASTVEFSTIDGPITAELSACGYAPGQDVLVEYLRTDPQQVRLAGTGTQESSTLRRLLPIGVLFFGLVAAGALVVLATQPSGRRHATPGASSSEAVGEPESTAEEVPAGTWLVTEHGPEHEDRTATELLPGATPAESDGRVLPS